MIIGEFKNTPVKMSAQISSGYAFGGSVEIIISTSTIPDRHFSGQAKSFWRIRPGEYTTQGEGEKEKAKNSPFLVWQEKNRQLLVAAEEVIFSAVREQFPQIRRMTRAEGPVAVRLPELIK